MLNIEVLIQEVGLVTPYLLQWGRNLFEVEFKTCPNLSKLVLTCLNKAEKIDVARRKHDHCKNHQCLLTFEGIT